MTQSAARSGLAWFIAALAAIAGLLLWMLQSRAAPQSIATLGAPAPAPTPADASAAPASTTERIDAPALPAPASSADAVRAHVRGRCIAAETRQPLALCNVAFDGWGSNSNLVAMQGQLDWKDPPPALTSADGRLDIAFAPPFSLQFSLDITATGRVPRVRRRLVVRILQADGVTPAARQQFLCGGTGLQQPLRRTDDSGRIVFDPAPPGEIRLQALPGRTALDPIEMPAEKTEAEVTLTLPAAIGK
jgi:hypothetical protein